jgi:hypothetical protein
MQSKGTFMQNIFSRPVLGFLKRLGSTIFFALIILVLTSAILWAEVTKLGPTISLNKLVELALDHNSKNRANSKYLPPEEITFLIKKYYYQIGTQVEQLATAREIQVHFQKAIDKSTEIFDSGDGDVSQTDITKLKLGLSNTLDNIIGLEHDLQIVKLNLGMLINQELREGNDISTKDPIPIGFSYISFDDYLRSKNLTPKKNKLIGKADTANNKIYPKQSKVLTEENRLLLYRAYLDVLSSKARVVLGKNNRKITRALLISEVANYDFGIGDSQELFEALMIYTRVFSGYLDSVYDFNVMVAELEKIKNTIYSQN